MSLVRVGTLGRTHGVRGEIVLHDTSLTPLELHAVRSFTWRNRAGESRALTLETARPGRAWAIVRFEGVTDKDAAAKLTLGDLWVEPEQLPDPGPGVAYTFQLIGLSVRTEEGRVLGVLEQILATGAHPVYIVRGEKELLVPATPEVVRNVDLAAGVITVALPAGLEDL
jgi:16S rRNA processing protein RimM